MSQKQYITWNINRRFQSSFLLSLFRSLSPPFSPLIFVLAQFPSIWLSYPSSLLIADGGERWPRISIRSAHPVGERNLNTGEVKLPELCMCIYEILNTRSAKHQWSRGTADGIGCRSALGYLYLYPCAV